MDPAFSKKEPADSSRAVPEVRMPTRMLSSGRIGRQSNIGSHNSSNKTPVTAYRYTSSSRYQPVKKYRNARRLRTSRILAVVKW
jgi:hypothetical protein